MRIMNRIACAVLLWIISPKFALSDSAMFSNIKDDETVVFFHTVARLDETTQRWLIPIHGWIYEPQDSTLRLGVFAELLEHSYGLKATAENQENFKRRTNLLIADNERGKVIVIRIGEKTYLLPASAPNGHFKTTIEIQDTQLRPLLSGNLLSYTALTKPGETRRFTGQVSLVPAEGLSVISDIDDTVKLTEVTDHRQMFANTFFNDFKAIDGMSQIYRAWSDQAVAIHFVSSSPWQLYSPLVEFAEQAGFPWATFSLKAIRFRDETLLNLFKNGAETKPAQIEPYLKAFPRRRFVLVGDSGEQDPEVYAALLKKYPERIAQVYIRSVNEFAKDEQRLIDLFEGVDRTRWRLFTDPATLTLPVVKVTKLK